MQGICKLAIQFNNMSVTKPLASEYALYYHTYIGKVPQQDLLEALKDSSQKLLAFLRSLPEEKHHYRYAEGKWSIAELVAHLIDSERVFAYRALTFARNDKTALPGFDENEYAVESNGDNRSMASLIEEYEHLRKSNILLFEGLTKDMMLRTGIANGKEISVRALGYIISGHELHHMMVIQQRYL